jgi:tetratricopeptide (TPR) repeat protein
MGELELGLAELTEAVSIYREVGNRHGEAFGLSGIADILCLLGRCAEAEESAVAMYALAREIGDQRAEATALDCLGTVDYCFGRYREAVQRYRQAYDVAVETGDVQADVETNAGLARSLTRLGEVSEAIETCVAALDRCRQAGLRMVEGQLLNVLADAYLTQGDWAAAADRAAQAAAVHRETGARAGLVEALLYLGRAAAGAGDEVTARRHWRVGREIAGDLATTEALQLRALT